MNDIISKLYDETYPVGILAAEIQQVLLERDIWKRACELCNKATSGQMGSFWWYEQAKKAMEQE
jgi:hypothetical protein